MTIARCIMPEVGTAFQGMSAYACGGMTLTTCNATLQLTAVLPAEACCVQAPLKGTIFQRKTKKWLMLVHAAESEDDA